MPKTTMKDLEANAIRLGVEMYHDKKGEFYRASCPEGKRFDADLHELIAVYGDMSGNSQTPAEARSDLLYRLRGYAALELCDNPQCDWCHPETVPA